MTINESFKGFQYFNFETNFMENENFSQKSGVPFLVETTALRLKTRHFHSKLLCQEPILRKIEWQLRNGPITISGVLPVITLLFGKTFPVLEPLKKS